MSAPLSPLRSRIAPLLAVLFGAPVAAEYLQGYMSSTGQALEILGSLLILGPLYGGAALLIREVAVRAGMGWAGIALLATAFGLAMPGLIDLALFAEHRSEIPYWNDMRTTTLVSSLGISAYSTLSWVSAHVIMSICTPLALLEALSPRHRGRPMLGWPGITFLGILWILAGTFIRLDGISLYGYSPTLAQTAVVAAIVVVLAALAWTRIGWPAKQKGAGARTRSLPAWLLPPLSAFAVMLFDLVPWTWPGTATLAALLSCAVLALHLVGRFMRWTATDIGLLAAGTLVGRTALGFFAPLTEGVSREAVIAQNSILLACALTIAGIAYRRALAERRSVNATAAEPEPSNG